MKPGRRIVHPEHFIVVYKDTYTSETCWPTVNPLNFMVDKASRFGSRLVVVGVDAFKNQSDARRQAMANAHAGQHVELK